MCIVRSRLGPRPEVRASRRRGAAVRPVAVATLLAVVATLLGTPLDARAEEATHPPRRVSVHGDAEVRVVPDEVILALGVESFDPDLAAARQDNDRRVTAVLAAVREAGVAPEHASTDYLEVHPEWRHGRPRGEFLGYLVRRTIVVRLRDVSAFEGLLSAVLEAGADHVHGVDFRTTKLKEHRDRARSLALRAAREKAEALAAELGHGVGRPLSIDEGHAGWWSPYGSWWGRHSGGLGSQSVVQVPGGGAATEGPTAPGQIAVTARVSATFELVGPDDGSAASGGAGSPASGVDGRDGTDGPSAGGR